MTRAHELLLTELDYLVNVYDTTKCGEPAITYSGKLDTSIVYSGKNKISIKDIHHYLYSTKHLYWEIFLKDNREILKEKSGAST